jgi:hypothetical protein
MVPLAMDAAPLRFRRLVEAELAAERERAAATASAAAGGGSTAGATRVA